MDPDTDRGTEELRVNAIRREIETTRTRVAETLDALRYKGDLLARLGELLAAVAEGTAAHVAQRLTPDRSAGIDEDGSRRPETMSEFEGQSGDGEIAVCHVCAKEFPTQKALLAHLEEAHDGELLD